MTTSATPRRACARTSTRSSRPTGWIYAAGGSPCWPTPACSATSSTRSRVFWCHRPDGRLECVVVEVHNTYGDRHAYLVRPDGSGRASTSKELYVSPFNDVSGSYDLLVPEPGRRAHVHRHLDPPGTPALRRDPGRRRQARHARRRPAHRRDAAPRTPHRHGPDQVARRPPLGAPAADPAPTHPLPTGGCAVTTLSPDQRNLGGFSAPRLDTSRWPDLTRAPSALKRTVHARVARRLFEQAARRLDVRVELPDGTAIGRAAHVPNAPVMVLHRPERFLERLGARRPHRLRRVLHGRRLGLDRPRRAADRLRRADGEPGPASPCRGCGPSTSPGCRGPSGTRTNNTRSNISRHYDLSNAMFEQFLDETMSYSSALFDAPRRSTRRSGPTSLRRRPARSTGCSTTPASARVPASSRSAPAGASWRSAPPAAARPSHSVTLSQRAAGARPTTGSRRPASRTA